MHIQFYDQILTEIQSGNVKDGITLLVGMLDGLAQDDRALAAATASLKSHSLWSLLLEDPICASANAIPRQPALLVDLICDQAAPASTSSTGQRLFDVTLSLTFARAIRERAKTAEEKLVRAWQAGAQICILGPDNLRALRPLAGQDVSNVTFVDPDPECLARSKETFGKSLVCVNAPADAFDLICATTVADHLVPQKLAALLAQTRTLLTEQGTLHIASFVPQHLGSGWRRACLGWDIECHSEAQITQIAAHASLSARTYRDTTDSVVWGEFRLADETSNRGDLDNG